MKKYIPPLMIVVCVLAALVVVFLVSALREASNPPPTGGLWVSPADNQVIKGPIHFEARGYPAKLGDPPVAYVQFSAAWDGHPGAWLMACKLEKPVLSDYYACDWNPANWPEKVPAGRLHVSFDVVNVNRDYNVSPNGPRTITWHS